MGWFVRAKIKETIDEDAWLLEQMADYDTGIEGMKLSRFDKVLGITRERLRKVYDGEPAHGTVVEACSAAHGDKQCRI